MYTLCNTRIQEVDINDTAVYVYSACHMVDWTYIATSWWYNALYSLSTVHYGFISTRSLDLSAHLHTNSTFEPMPSWVGR